jgi:hypothetical protein
MRFKFWKKDKFKTVNLLDKNWQILDIIEYEHLPSRGHLIYLSTKNLYYRVNEIIEYVAPDDRLVRRYLIVELVDSALIKPVF